MLVSVTKYVTYLSWHLFELIFRFWRPLQSPSKSKHILPFDLYNFALDSETVGGKFPRNDKRVGLQGAARLHPYSAGRWNLPRHSRQRSSVYQSSCHLYSVSFHSFKFRTLAGRLKMWPLELEELCCRNSTETRRSAPSNAAMSPSMGNR